CSTSTVSGCHRPRGLHYTSARSCLLRKPPWACIHLIPINCTIIPDPVGSDYTNPLRPKQETHFTRGAEGGVGFSKNAGNYALSLHPTRLAQEEGFDQLMWTDANEHKYVEEAGTANLLFRVGDTIITPSSDTILHGITRRTIIEIARHWG